MLSDLRMGLNSYYKHFSVHGTLDYSRLCCNPFNPHCIKISVKIRNSEVPLSSNEVLSMLHDWGAVFIFFSLIYFGEESTLSID